MENRVQYRSK